MAAERHVGALDGLRGLAVAIVVVHHLRVGGWGGLYVGVDVFFALSGFLITRSLLRVDGPTLVPALTDFWGRRLWRIVPALLLLLGVFVVASLGAGDRGLRLHFALSGLLQHLNVDMTIGPPTSPHLGHLWSLAAEMQFYALWPLLLLPLVRRGTSPGRLLALPTALVVATAVERYALERSGTSWGRLYFGPDVRSTALFVGCAAALLVHWRDQGGPAMLGSAPRAAAALALPAVGFIAWYGRTATLLSRPHLGWGITVVCVAAGVLVLHAHDGRRSPVNQVLTLRPVVWLGRVSYGVYLWHVLLIAFALARWPHIGTVQKALVVVPGTLAIAAASWRWLERPLLDLAARRRRAARATAAPQAVAGTAA
jgi:peptidoglycan/LPS O-acetylase OafA/YrhL